MIRTRGLAYRYGAGPPLQFADVDLPQGGTLLLQGRSGTGKSTWLALVAGLRAAAGAPVNRVTVYRMLDRFAAAGLLHKQVDAARVMRYALAPQGEEGAAPRFECDDCHQQFRLSQSAAPVQSALQEVLQALASAGHEGLAVDIAVRGRCAGCAHLGTGAAA